MPYGERDKDGRSLEAAYRLIEGQWRGQEPRSGSGGVLTFPPVAGRLAPRRRLRGRHRHRHALGNRGSRQRLRPADAIRDQQAVQIVRARYRLAVEAHDDVPSRTPASEAGLPGSTDTTRTPLSTADRRTARPAEQRNILDADADVAPPHAPLAEQRRNHDPRRVDRHCEAEAWPPRIIAVFTPTTFPRPLTSGPPELPGLSAASVWMMLSINRPDRDRERAPERADHADGHRVLKPVRNCRRPPRAGPA